jgi:hypothetical protein
MVTRALALICSRAWKSRERFIRLGTFGEDQANARETLGLYLSTFLARRGYPTHNIHRNLKTYLLPFAKFRIQITLLKFLLFLYLQVKKRGGVLC